MRKPRPKPEQSPLVRDIIGIASLAIGAVLMLGLFLPNSGWLGRPLADALKWTAGIGASAIPILLMVFGLAMLVGAGERIPIGKWIGFGLLFLVFSSCCQFYHSPSVTGLVSSGQIHADDVQLGGGFAGLALAWVLEKAVGRISSYVVLAAITVVSGLLIANVSVKSIVEAIAERRQSRRKPKIRGIDDGGRKPEPARKPGPERSEADESRRTEIIEAIKKKIHPDASEASKAGNVRAEPIIHSGAAKKAPERPVQFNDGSEYKLPPITLLNEPAPPPKRAESELRAKIDKIEQTLEEFKIQADVVEVSHGPTVTRYEIQLAPGIRVQKIVSLADNLAMSLAAIDVRLEAPIPGKSAIGVEVPNNNPATVCLREVIDCDEFWNASSRLTFALGKDVAGEPRFADLVRMPHMLVAGATNAGKSVGLNTLICSLLYRATPRELKLVLIDPKRVEFSLFEGVPHLCTPVVKDVRQAAGILRSVLKEMDRRYDCFVRLGARNIESYNAKVKPEEKLPFMVVIVDELADLMMQVGPEVEFSIGRLAQLARATGIHLVIATQRPSVDVITGKIKANISSRLSFAVNSAIDSRTILDMAGAERLIGRGDMLFKPIDAGKPTRIQGCYISEKETEALVSYLKEQESPDYTMEPAQIGEGGSADSGVDDVVNDEMYEPVVRLVVSNGYASTSMIQRKFKIGYTRAARLVDAMEAQGIVGPLDGAKPREVLIGKGEIDRIFGGLLFNNAPAASDDDIPEEDEEL
jgi:S-DNA-T family DNA segregation ATPase FtsK/SpoIIIE